uniref:Peptidase A1 domain-containing protein n=1 Tax=Salix viminalis TaxID=40686 RepID=A0A6N2NDH2_SALVM
MSANIEEAAHGNYRFQPSTARQAWLSTRAHETKLELGLYPFETLNLRGHGRTDTHQDTDRLEKYDSCKDKFQTLTINPLPEKPTLSWADTEPESETQTLSDSTSSEASTPTSLSVQLHHLDALSSDKTPQDLFNSRLTRDASRVRSLTSLAAAAGRTNGTRARGPGFSSSVISGLAQGSGEYSLRLGVGTPQGICFHGARHWKRRRLDPVRLDSPGCNTKKQVCVYQVSYGDGSFTYGEFSTETLTFRGNRVGRVALGCGHDNEGLFVGAAGLLGLGRGRLSFPSQIGRRFNRKFSYCLVDRSASSKPSSMVFGDSAISRTARFTPLVSNPKLDTFYYVELLGISVGGTRVPGITASLFKLDSTGNGGVIIDSGTSVTRLTRPAYMALRNAFRVGASNLKRAPEFSLFDTCFDLSVDSSGSFCFAFAGTMSGLSIIGNIQQQGFRVVYDLAASRVGFTPRGCA